MNDDDLDIVSLHFGITENRGGDELKELLPGDFSPFSQFTEEGILCIYPCGGSV